jgi:hypothetical protein
MDNIESQVDLKSIGTGRTPTRTAALDSHDSGNHDPTDTSTTADSSGTAR